MTPQQKEEKLNRYRKLWSFAMSKGNKNWADRIKNDAEKIKARLTEEEATFEQARGVFGIKLPIDIPAPKC